jgi:AcrR family transcriptional regulator
MSITKTSQEDKSLKTKQTLIDSASQLFLKYGVNKVTIDDICNNCGLTKGSFYHYFPSKNYIVAFSINAGLDNHIEENYIHNENLSVIEEFTHFNLCTFDYFYKIGKELTGLSFVSMINTYTDVHIEGRSYVDILTSIVKKAKSELFIANMNDEEAYHHCSSIITGILMEWCIKNEKLNDSIDWKKLIKIKSKLCLKK